jgi:hypothetical protein
MLISVETHASLGGDIVRAVRVEPVRPGDRRPLFRVASLVGDDYGETEPSGLPVRLLSRDP